MARPEHPHPQLVDNTHTTSRCMRPNLRPTSSLSGLHVSSLAGSLRRCGGFHYVSLAVIFKPLNSSRCEAWCHRAGSICSCCHTRYPRPASRCAIRHPPSTSATRAIAEFVRAPCLDLLNFPFATSPTQPRWCNLMRRGCRENRPAASAFLRSTPFTRLSSSTRAWHKAADLAGACSILQHPACRAAQRPPVRGKSRGLRGLVALVFLSSSALRGPPASTLLG